MISIHKIVPEIRIPLFVDAQTALKVSVSVIDGFIVPCGCAAIVVQVCVCAHGLALNSLCVHVRTSHLSIRITAHRHCDNFNLQPIVYESNQILYKYGTLIPLKISTFGNHHFRLSLLYTACTIQDVLGFLQNRLFQYDKVTDVLGGHGIICFCQFLI